MRTSDEPKGESFEPQADLLAPDEVRALSQLSNVRATLAVLESFAILGAAIAGAVLFPHPAIVFLAIVVIAGGQHALAVLAHEAAHYRLYRARWVNDLFGRLCAAPIGLSMISYRLIHRIHHNHLYEPIDPDLALMAGYPRGKAYLLKKLAKDLFGLTVVKNFSYFLGKPPSTGDDARDDTSNGLRKAARVDQKLVIAANLGAFAFFLAIGRLETFLLLWTLPLVTVLQVILRFRAVLEHGAVTDTSTPLCAARTNLPPRAIAWWLFPHHVHYHIEHHLYPSVPMYRLAECHRRLKDRGALDGAEVATLGRAMQKIFAAPRS
jgi:fatty acid desaturase